MEKTRNVAARNCKVFTRRPEDVSLQWYKATCVVCGARRGSGACGLSEDKVAEHFVRCQEQAIRRGPEYNNPTPTVTELVKELVHRELDARKGKSSLIHPTMLSLVIVLGILSMLICAREIIARSLGMN